MTFIYCKKCQTFLILLVFTSSCIQKNYCGNTKETTSQRDSQNVSEGSFNIQDLSKRFQQESIGILPIAEIIRKANLPYFTYPTPTMEQMANNTVEVEMKNVTTEKTTTPKTNIVRPAASGSTLKILLEGTKLDILKIPYKQIMNNLKYIERIDLPLEKKLLLWETIKKEKIIEEMDRDYLQQLYGLVYCIPENEYIYINTSDWNVVDFFGTSKLLSRRQAAIIAYAMKHRHGEVIIQDSGYINKLKGLICGFSQMDLKNISIAAFKNIERPVFANLWPCTSEQLNVLLNTAQKPETYSHYELWNEHILRKLGLLVTMIKIEDFNRFYSKVFNGLEPEVIEYLSDDQRQWLGQKKLLYKNEKMLVFYGVKSTNETASVMPMNYNCILLILMYYLVLKY